jgi:ABC-type lipoprotein export system ATPase subunit
MRYLLEFAREGGSVLLATHDLRAAQHAATCLHMDGGRLVVEEKTVGAI